MSIYTANLTGAIKQGSWGRNKRKVITITLNEIKASNPCKDGWKKLLRSLNKTDADDTPVTFSYIAESNSVPDSLWCVCALGDKYLKERCYLVADIAESVSYLYTKDESVKNCINAIRDYGNGRISKEELHKKRDAAVAAYAAYAVSASTVASAASAAASTAASAAYAASFAVSAYTAAAVASAVASAAVAAAEREKQKTFIKKHFG